MSATNRGAVRNERDFYPTPDYSTKSLLDHVDLMNVTSFKEPCLGDGAIYNLINVPCKYYDELELGLNYLETPLVQVDLIITNPPFTFAKEFLRKSLQEAKTVCYLLRLNYLGAQDRKEFWKEIGTPDKLLILSKRPSFTGKGTDATEYAWFCWDRGEYIKLSKGIHIL